MVDPAIPPIPGAAFEFAALDWITGEQKVTQVQGDADVYGWADGVLVCFEIRGSRMSGLRLPQCRTGGSA